MNYTAIAETTAKHIKTSAKKNRWYQTSMMPSLDQVSALADIEAKLQKMRDGDLDPELVAGWLQCQALLGSIGGEFTVNDMARIIHVEGSEDDPVKQETAITSPNIKFTSADDFVQKIYLDPKCQKVGITRSMVFLAPLDAYFVVQNEVMADYVLRMTRMFNRDDLKVITLHALENQMHGSKRLIVVDHTVTHSTRVQKQIEAHNARVPATNQ